MQNDNEKEIKNFIKNSETNTTNNINTDNNNFDNKTNKLQISSYIDNNTSTLKNPFKRILSGIINKFGLNAIKLKKTENNELNTNNNNDNDNNITLENKNNIITDNSKNISENNSQEKTHKKQKFEIEFKEIKNAKYKNGGKFKSTPKWIAVHYTAVIGASAESCASSFSKTTRAVSTHFFCDSKNIYRCVDEKHIAWHVGNGSVQQPYKDETLTLQELIAYGDKPNWRFKSAAENHLKWKKDGEDFKGNYYAFGVDICTLKKNKNSKSATDEDWYFNEKAVKNAEKCVAYLCHKYNIDIDHVIRHADATGKPCLPINKTEIYTPNGFVPLEKIKINDTVFQYNKKTNSLEETKVLSVVEPYLSTIHKNKDYEATNNHITLYKDKDGSIKADNYENIINKEVYLLTYNNKTIESNYKLEKQFSSYDGIVSCIEVQFGYLVIKQNNTVFITGNCPRPLVSLSGDKDKTKNDNLWLDFKRNVQYILDNYKFD